MTKRKLAVGGLVVIAALIATTATLRHGLTSSTALHVPATIDATGATDVTRKLNAFLRSVPNDSTVVFGAKARYKAEGTVFLQFKQGIHVEGNDARIFAETDGSGFMPDPNAPWFNPRGWPGNRSHFLLYHDTDITVSHLRTRGPNPGGPGTYNPNLEGQAGIEISACVRC